MRGKDVRVYIASPYSDGDPAQRVENVYEAMRAASDLMDAGHEPFVPLLSHYLDERHPKSYERWMQWALNWVPQCEALLRLEGESSGADREEALARKLGIPVYRSVDQLAA